jgi:hypothetical protein
MTNAEMNRRLATMTQEQIDDVKRMIAEGFGAAGIAGSSRGTYFKQVNAVFQLVAQEQAAS